MKRIYSKFMSVNVEQASSEQFLLLICYYDKDL